MSVRLNNSSMLSFIIDPMDIVGFKKNEKWHEAAEATLGARIRSVFCTVVDPFEDARLIWSPLPLRTKRLEEMHDAKVLTVVTPPMKKVCDVARFGSVEELKEALKELEGPVSTSV